MVCVWGGRRSAAEFLACDAEKKICPQAVCLPADPLEVRRVGMCGKLDGLYRLTRYSPPLALETLDIYLPTQHDLSVTSVFHPKFNIRAFSASKH